MAHFTITLPQGWQAAVRRGTIRRKRVKSIFDLFRKNGIQVEEKVGYIIKVERTREYRLLKSKEGKWLTNGPGGFELTPEDEISSVLKKAIDAHERQAGI